MLEITPTGQFKKDFKTCKKRGYDMSLLQQIIDILAILAMLPLKKRPTENFLLPPAVNAGIRRQRRVNRLLNGQMKSFRPTTLAEPYFKADIPNISIDYRDLTAFARNKGCKVCDLTDEEKNLFITDADMNIVRECTIKLYSYDRQCTSCDRHP